MIRRTRRTRPPLDKYAFKLRVREWAARIGVQPKEIHVRTMVRKWASCTTAGRVSFSTLVLAEPADFRDYVIVHELLHLQVPNHGKLFKALLSGFLPNWERVAGRKRYKGGMQYGRLVSA